MNSKELLQLGFKCVTLDPRDFVSLPRGERTKFSKSRWSELDKIYCFLQNLFVTDICQRKPLRTNYSIGYFYIVKSMIFVLCIKVSISRNERKGENKAVNSFTLNVRSSKFLFWKTNYAAMKKPSISSLHYLAELLCKNMFAVALSSLKKYNFITRHHAATVKTTCQ